MGFGGDFKGILSLILGCYGREDFLFLMGGFIRNGMRFEKLPKGSPGIVGYYRCGGWGHHECSQEKLMARRGCLFVERPLQNAGYLLFRSYLFIFIGSSYGAKGIYTYNPSMLQTGCAYGTEKITHSFYKLQTGSAYGTKKTKHAFYKQVVPTAQKNPNHSLILQTGCAYGTDWQAS